MHCRKCSEINDSPMTAGIKWFLRTSFLHMILHSWNSAIEEDAFTFGTKYMQNKVVFQ